MPYQVATNPQHIGRWTELNTAEALAAALWILGEPGRARALIEGFPGGRAFFEVNAGPLARYAAARDPDEIRSAERDLFGAHAREMIEPAQS